jgi:hypothetical protein
MVMLAVREPANLPDELAGFGVQLAKGGELRIKRERGKWCVAVKRSKFNARSGLSKPAWVMEADVDLRFAVAKAYGRPGGSPTDGDNQTAMYVLETIVPRLLGG